MNLRLKCSCGARLSTSEALRGRMVRCPKCRKALRVPATVPPADDEAEAITFAAIDSDPAPAPFESDQPDSAWQSHDTGPPRATAHRSGAWKWLLLMLVFLVPLAVVGVLVALPYFQPKDPRELVAQRYLEALARQDFVEAGRLSVLTTHPRLVGVEQVAVSDEQSAVLRGPFHGLRRFHDEIDKRYRFNADRGRFEPTDELGLGLGALSQLEEVKKKAEAQIEANKADPARHRKNPEEQMLDDALATYGAIGELASRAGGLFSTQTLGPTYEDLLQQTKVPLSDSERRLAEHFGRDAAKWQFLLGRPFFELPDLGSFEFYDVEIQGTIRTEGQSLGEPGRPINLRLVRFVMGSIDSGWRVWQAE